jgi:rubredoxin
MTSPAQQLRKWMCLTCGHVYDEAEGDPAAGFPAGTRFEDLPLSWRCPDCGAGKEEFELLPED